MENLPPILPMYSNHLPANAGKSLFTCQVQGVPLGDVTLTFYEKCLLEMVGKKRQVMVYDFDLLFEFTTDPLSITFSKEQDGKQQNTNKIKRVKFFLQSEADLYACRQILMKKLNQRGFHEQFKPKKKIGKGNFASVYLAEKNETGRQFAVKAFSKEAAYSEQKGKECLIKEIQIMRNLDHRLCMQLYEVFESENSLYIVVELLEGGQLYDKIKNKYKFTSRETKVIIYSILQGLREMHKKNIMHRDLKPENLIFRRNGDWECVIADFGLAEFANVDEYLFVRCGTPGYVAPEVINIKDLKGKYHPICDMFSMGLIFHILLTGTSAFPGKTYNEVLSQNRSCNFDFDAQIYKSLQPDALNLMVKMLKKHPEDRISAEDALDHPYFSSHRQLMEQSLDIPSVIQTGPRTPQPNCQSPLLTSTNPARKLDKSIKKDSCVDFKMGKENVLTGKVDTITDTASTKNSVGKRFDSITPKVSKFSAKKKQ